jgi:branched-chain amino acid transport system substrate-binding protein
MRNHHKWSHSIASALTGGIAVYAVLVGAVSVSSAADKKGAVVGFITELSGPASLFGEAAWQAAQVAADEVNAAGGVNGGKLELKVGDDATDPTTARQIWEKMISQGVDAVIFRETSASRVAALPVGEKANIPAIYANDYEGGDCRPVLYTVGAVEAMKLPAYLQFLKEQGGSKFFLVATDYNAPRATLDMVKKGLPGLGAETVGEEYTPFNTTDYSAIISKIRSSGANALFMELIGGPDNSAFYKQARSAGLFNDIKVVGNIALDDGTLATVGNAAKGVYMAQAYLAASDLPASQKFLNELKKKFGSDMRPQGYLTEPSYDAVHLYAIAANKAGTTASGPVLKALSETEFTDSPKGTIKLTPDRHAAQPIYIMQAQDDGTYKVIKSLGVQVPPRQCDPYPPFGK